ncbi:MAG: response regulator, partial [Proteobacteria bacterium]|nr:response regulator [Pseudomonadota bacterium]
LLEELRTLLAAAMSKKAQLELDIGARSVVLGDRTTLTQVLMNLLTNASDALESRPGRIVVTTRRIAALDARWDDALGATRTANAWVLVEVRDTGVGMAAATRERVFEPFFSTKKHGHGLGLAACLGIVKSHGGAVLVESELGEGTCFSIVLPASELVGLPEHASEPIAPAARKVLVVDDEELVRSLIRRALVPFGHVVADAASGLAALAMFEQVAADVILVDLTMPDIDGIEVVKRIRATGSRVPIVLTSGYLNVLADRPADRGLIDHFLPKPFSVSELLAALELAIARAG